MNRKQLHKRVTELQKLMEQGYVRFEKPSPIQDSVSNVRFDKKGTVVPESVDENVRALITLVELY